MTRGFSWIPAWMEVPLPPRLSWIPACMENPLTRCFGWIPAFAGMTETDDSNTRTLSIFLPRQRGQILWPWPACAGMTGVDALRARTSPKLLARQQGGSPPCGLVKEMTETTSRHSRGSGNPLLKFLARQWGSLPPLGAFLDVRRLVAAPGRRAALAGLLLGALLAGCGFPAPRAGVHGRGSGQPLSSTRRPRCSSISNRRSRAAHGVASAEPGRRGRGPRRRVGAIRAASALGRPLRRQRARSRDRLRGRLPDRSGIGSRRHGPAASITLVREFLYTPEEIVAKEHEEGHIRAGAAPRGGGPDPAPRRGRDGQRDVGVSPDR